MANQRYALYHDDHGKSFDYVSGASGVSAASLIHSGWGAQFLDYDNDGWKDLLVAQGHVMDNIELTQPALRYKEPLLLLRNSEGRFSNVSPSAGAPFRLSFASRGMACGDLNNDGFPDIAINCNDGPALVLMNQGGNGAHWLIVNTVGSRSNRDGIGARMKLISDSGRPQYAFVSTAGSYLSSGDRRVHFGLGTEQSVRLLEIIWPNGTLQRLQNIKSDQILTVREPAA